MATKKLLIVESPAKAGTIKKYLGKDYTVMASMGHIIDLPKSQMGIDFENDYTPKYITIRGKGQLLTQLKKEAKKADVVYLATDPDREGEAISWHLAEALKIDPESNCRVTFNEITKTAVKAAIKQPRKIDMDLVDAQQARRVLDRIVGYTISPILWEKVKRGLSAGRVQSVATKLICDREEEIENFTPQEYWSIETVLNDPKSKKDFNAKYYGEKGKEVKLNNAEETKKVSDAIANADFVIEKVKRGQQKRNPQPPFTTSTLQQDASRKYNFQAAKTMQIAQTLYEGINLGGKIGSINIKPIDIKDKLTNDQYRLYKLIWERFAASQMTSAVYDTMQVTIDANGHTFKASGSNIKFKGYMTVYVESTDNKEKKEKMLPNLEENQTVTLKSSEEKQHFTQPPARYSDATLIKELEENGIGRPSTYAPTISTIVSRGYVVRSKKQLVPTELGFVTSEIMKNNFSDIVDVEFTADMEKELDSVEEGELNWKKLINDFYPSFKDTLEKAQKNIEKIQIKDEESDVVCEKCGRKMVYKLSKFGKFLACPGYPECKNTKAIREETGAKCPKCSGEILVKKSRRGKVYYGCEHSPKCDFMVWDMPVNDEACPQCGGLLLKKQGRNGKIFCYNEDCKYERKLKDEKK